MPKLGERQAALYDVEHATTDRAGLRWHRVADAQVYLSALIDTEWFFELAPHVTDVQIVRRGAGSRWSTCERHPSGGAILVADGALKQSVVLHELAHLICPNEEGHGDLFARTLAELVHHEMGFFAWSAFLHGLRAAGFRL